MFLISSLKFPMPKMCFGRLILPFSSSLSADLEMRGGDSDEGRRFPSLLRCPKPSTDVAWSPIAPIPPGSRFGAALCEASPTRFEYGGIPGGFPLDRNVPCRILMNIREGTVRSLLPLCKSISVVCVEVIGEG